MTLADMDIGHLTCGSGLKKKKEKRSRLRVAQAPRSPLATRPTVHVSRFFIDQVLSFFLRGDINRGVYSMMYEGAQSKVLDHQAVVVW
jgi:hypothetical protein